MKALWLGTTSAHGPVPALTLAPHLQPHSPSLAAPGLASKHSTQSLRAPAHKRRGGALHHGHEGDVHQRQVLAQEERATWEKVGSDEKGIER